MAVRIFRTSLVAFAAILFSLAGDPTAVTYAAGETITVTTTDDELNSDGDCSLREAIQAANTDTAIDACEAGSGPDTISLQENAVYTLTFGGVREDAGVTGDLDITDDLT